MSPLAMIDPRTTAVVCIECQQGILGDNSILPDLQRDSAHLVPAIGLLLDAARAVRATVVHATFGGPMGGKPSGTAGVWRRMGPATRDWTPGSAPTTVLPELLGAGDLVIPRHHGLFPTSDSELLPVLRGRGVQTVALVGVSLNLAIPHTVGDLSQAGFGVVVPRDAVAGTPAEYGDQVLSNTVALMARITTTGELIGQWARPSARL
ncbi:isochorismatase family protein [Rhodococcoides yunnanense]|uniref:Isochorismatase family protein n=1 Tax=Rhodococcoides yunnanense TaxID=278209 RepID=A0ABU4BKU3_9NOCA|nr:isochorismatase family protein [Rhodococcus yunnanensis]MDV6264698.1 isochorismatase family protein [Rhodococcus yunnanensis]